MLYDKHGSQMWVVAVKGTFDIRPDGTTAAAEAQEPISLVSSYVGEPGASHMTRDAELAPHHPGTDVILNAVARAPGGEPTGAFEVAVDIGPLSKKLIVSGTRRWVSARGELSPSAPEPFVSLPLRWEHAFGGSDPRTGSIDARNPIGRGYHLDRESALDAELPAIEAPMARIAAWDDRPTPVGFGAVAPSWSPRTELAGTFDDDWTRTRAPLWPSDYDERFHCCAADGLWVGAGLRGGERVKLTHLTPEPVFAFALPRVFLGFDTRIGASAVHHRAALDRVIIEPERRKVMMVWRTTLTLGARVRDVSRTTISQKQKVG